MWRKSQATIQTSAYATPKEYFTYGLYPVNLSDITVEDTDKCSNYAYNSPYNRDKYCPVYQYKDACENKEWGLNIIVPTNEYAYVGLKLSDNALVFL